MRKGHPNVFEESKGLQHIPERNQETMDLRTESSKTNAQSRGSEEASGERVLG